MEDTDLDWVGSCWLQRSLRASRLQEWLHLYEAGGMGVGRRGEDISFEWSNSISKKVKGRHKHKPLLLIMPLTAIGKGLLPLNTLNIIPVCHISFEQQLPAQTVSRDRGRLLDCCTLREPPLLCTRAVWNTQSAHAHTHTRTHTHTHTRMYTHTQECTHIHTITTLQWGPILLSTVSFTQNNSHGRYDTIKHLARRMKLHPHTHTNGPPAQGRVGPQNNEHTRNPTFHYVQRVLAELSSGNFAKKR